MKLTNYIRDAFIKAVMDDVPSIDYDEQIRVAVQKAALERLPKEVQKLWKDPATAPFVVRGTVRIGSYPSLGVAVPGFSRYGDPVGCDDANQAAAAFQRQFSELAEKRKAQLDQRSNLAEKLRTVAYGATTRKALLERLPEFEKYLPEETEKASNLPAVTNLVTNLVKAGWPKSANERRAAAKKKMTELVPA